MANVVKVDWAIVESRATGTPTVSGYIRMASYYNVDSPLVREIQC
jgi:hypothetical protein